MELLHRVSTAIDRAAAPLVERRLLLELTMLGLIAREHALFIGPPGTGKSAAVKAAAEQVSGRYFEYLIGRFTEPSELFGGLDLAALKAGEIRPVTTNMLPEANIAFLDEIFLGSTAILNTLLGVLNERVFRRGAYTARVPLWSCVAASNALPEDPMLAAFADRFLLTAFVEPVGEGALPALLAAGRTPPAASEPALTAGDLEELSGLLAAVELGPVTEAYAHILRKLRVGGLALSDRRLVKGQRLIAAAALLAGRQRATEEDLWPVVYMVQDATLQTEVKDLLASELAAGQNPMLTESVREASHGPAAQAAELVAYGRGLLGEKPEAPEAYEVWQVKLESLLTRIDAGFGTDKPEPLAQLRADLLAASAPEAVPANAPEAVPARAPDA